MARPERIKIKGEVAYYHIISRCVWEASRAFGSWEKESFVSLLQFLSEGYFVDIISYAVLSNHFHILLRTVPSGALTDEEILQRAEKIFGKGAVYRRGADYWRGKLEDISFFVKDLKQRYAQWYNRRHGRAGHLWGDRFKSILIQDGRAALAVSSYIDLNPVRAGVSKTLTSYRYTSYTTRKAGEGWLLPLGELYEGMDIKRYRKLLEEMGRQEREGKASLKRSETHTQETLLALRYRGEGLVFGSRAFVERFAGLLRRRPEKLSPELYIT